MKAMIQDMKEMTDSQELLESKPYPIISVFIYILITIILIALTWSYFGEIDDYIKANGIIRPLDKLSVVRNVIAGKVENVNFEEKQTVKKGDILYTIEHKGIDIDKNALTKQKNELGQELSNLKKLKQSILDGKNLFSKNSETEKDYFNKYIKYETELEINTAQENNSQFDLNQVKADANLTQKNASQKVVEIRDTLKNLQLLKQSIEQCKNLFNESSTEYYNKYVVYSYNIDNYKKAIEQKKVAYDNNVILESVGGVPKNAVVESMDLLTGAELELKKYQSDYVSSISNSITQNTQNLNDLEISLQGAQQKLRTLNNKTYSADITTTQLKNNKIIQIEDSIATNEQNLDKIDKDLKTVDLNIEQSTVRAPIDGVVNVLSEVNRGDLLQSGVEIASIVPDNNLQYKVQIYVSNKDIAGIKEGQIIKYQLLALPFKEYGEMPGKVTKIGIDSKVDEKSESSYYIVEAEVDNKPLYSYKGVKAEIKVGMDCEVHLITKSKKILYYLLEKLNLRD
ncbi:MAG: HlyD family efflux transporter periplasmic adaptor subunit [Ruminiclostridium sp.]